MKPFIFRLLLIFGTPLTYLSSIWLRFVRNADKFEEIGKYSDKIFMKVGLFPLLEHYYEPLINPKKHLHKSLKEDRVLPAVDFNINEQLELLKKFNYNNELSQFPINKKGDKEFYYNNGSYESGDAEYLYNIIRYFKPRNIIEIGSGSSTLMAINAITMNREENKTYSCKHICIEPYEQPWLSNVNVELVRERVEMVDKNIFNTLQKNDILFIDSSHIIRPQGDVLFEYLELLPLLAPGVLVHIHDIFSPKDYPENWIINNHLLWNEQYLLEAFLSFNKDFKVIGSLNFLTHNYRKEMENVCPIFSNNKNREAGAFWMIRV